ncbi:MAG: hypothetical protein V4516_10370 [Pseudomonadota bacterium]
MSARSEAAPASAASVPGRQPVLMISIDGLMPEAAPDMAVAEVAPETVAPSDVAPEIVVADALAGEAGAVTGVEAVSSTGMIAAPTETFAALSMPGTSRRAPIFDAVAKPAPAPEEQEVVVAISTSGGSQWGVSVGGFNSYAAAEKAMFKLALAESATLQGGLRKVVQRSDGYSASFLGLSEAQADLACRRLAARAVPCETVSQ